MTEQKQWTKKLLEYLAEYGLHAKDVEYGNGYFIFEHGEDMVVHFHIKELRGWKMGIWWDTDGKEKFEFFTQFERDIDKFKPAASTYVVEVDGVDDWSWNFVLEILLFIKHHPYKAWKLDSGFARDIWDYDYARGAFFKYWKSVFDDKRVNCIYRCMNKKLLKLINELVDGRLINPKVVDENKDGWRSSPRYSIFCEGAVGETLKPGHYALEHDELDPDEDKKLIKRIDKFNRKLDKHLKLPRSISLYELDMLHDRLCFDVCDERKKTK